LPHEIGPIQLVEQARRILDAHAAEPIQLKQLAEMVECSPFHLQREFVRLVGLSPKRYQSVQRMERFTSALKRGDSVTSATYEAGFGSVSRIYEQSAVALGITPSAFRQGGKGITIRYTTRATAIGRMLLAATDRGLVAVSFGDDDVSLIADLRRDYSHAVIRREPKRLDRQVGMVLRCMTGDAVENCPQLDVPSTPFQQKVWVALQRIPRGSTSTYRDIAEMIGRPTAARAVARACATNRIAVAIPCHRVVREDGALAAYRWGISRKQALLALERHPPHDLPHP
jgi:AraC family transcriptional regulator of adaptative response/methylated-DNA-[protein]-cysteine methyltransferase